MVTHYLGHSLLIFWVGYILSLITLHIFLLWCSAKRLNFCMISTWLWWKHFCVLFHWWEWLLHIKTTLLIPEFWLCGYCQYVEYYIVQGLNIHESSHALYAIGDEQWTLFRAFENIRFLSVLMHSTSLCFNTRRLIVFTCSGISFLVFLSVI